MEKELKDQVALKDISNCIFFKGSSAQIPELLPDFDYLLQPTYMECFSLSILESLAANVPVITTIVGGNPEVIVDGENGFLFEAGGITSLKKILEEILWNKRPELGCTRTKIEEQYNLDLMIKNHFQIANN
jgi:glycosyltransferase involved in cell wall biosynthesis